MAAQPDGHDPTATAAHSPDDAQGQPSCQPAAGRVSLPGYVDGRPQGMCGGGGEGVIRGEGGGVDGREDIRPGGTDSRTD